MKALKFVALALLPAVWLTPAPCHAGAPALDADGLVTDFVYQSLVLSPVAASATGYHMHESARLDALWDDYSAAGLDKIRQFNRQLLHRIDALKHARLDAERQADLDIIRDAAHLKLLELDRIQDFRHNPTQYVELIGNGLYTPFVLNYAPPEVRFQDLIGRLRGLPAPVRPRPKILICGSNRSTARVPWIGCGRRTPRPRQCSSRMPTIR